MVLGTFKQVEGAFCAVVGRRPLPSTMSAFGWNEKCPGNEQEKNRKGQGGDGAVKTIHLK